MRSSLMEAKAHIEYEGYTLEQIRDYLDEIRDTGRINLYGAGDYLIKVWGFNSLQASPIVEDYMNCGLREDMEPSALSYGIKREGVQDGTDTD